MDDIANVATKPDEIKITHEMIEAGEDAVLSCVGGADLGGYFSARDLAVAVFLAMRSAGSKSLIPAGEHNPLA